MNKTCETCFARTIPEEVRDAAFKYFVGKTIECPIDNEKITCIYSKLEVNWENIFSILRKKGEEHRKGSI